MRIPTPGNIRQKTLCADVRGVALEIVQARRAQRVAAAATVAANAPAASTDASPAPARAAAALSVASTLLDLLIDAQDDGERLSDSEVVDQAVTFLLAGKWWWDLDS